MRDRPSGRWLVWTIFEGDTLIHDDGVDDPCTDASDVLMGVFGDFVAANCLRPTDLTTIRAEISRDGHVIAVLDGRDW